MTNRLSRAQRRAIVACANLSARPDGWLALAGFDHLQRPTLRALVVAGLLEAKHPDPFVVGGQEHRLTPAGRRAALYG